MYLLPEFMDLKLFGKTMLVVDDKFSLIWASTSTHQLVLPLPPRGLHCMRRPPVLLGCLVPHPG